MCTRASSDLKVEDTYAFIAFFAFIAFGAAFAAFIALAIAMRVVGGGRALGEGTLKPELPTGSELRESNLPCDICSIVASLWIQNALANTATTLRTVRTWLLGRTIRSLGAQARDLLRVISRIS